MIEQSLLHYRILEKIGQGGMGVVYKALDTRLDRLVAIKTLPAIDDPKRKQRFVWEARAAARLRHPHIVVVHDIASDAGTDFIVMEYIPGAPLSERLSRARLGIPETLAYARQIASALEAAHVAGIVHRDLKPSNILVTPEGSVKLVDFGLARLQPQAAEGQSETNAIAGTAGYMSPEQAEGKPATPESDIFSFGAVLYEMATGHRAFTGESAASALAAVLRDDPERPSSLTPGLPVALEKIIEQCLRKDPARRYRHIGDVRLALEEIQPEPATQRRFSPRLRRGAAYLALAAAPVLAGVLLLSRRVDPEPNSMPVPLTGFVGAERSATWSPDGRQVAFVWNGEKQGDFAVYLLQPGSSQTLQLTNAEGTDAEPAWSPDGRWIAYIHMDHNRTHYSLNLVSPLGGPDRVVFTNTAPVHAPNWTPDGRTLLASIVPEPQAPAAISAIPLDTGERRPITSPPAGIPGDRDPAISPDAQTLAFCRTTAWRTSELYLLNLNPDLSPHGAPRRVTDLSYVEHPTWTADGDRILFGASHDGVGIWQIDRKGGRLRPVFGAPETASLPALGQRPGGFTSLVFTNTVNEVSLWRFGPDVGPVGGPVEIAPSSRSQRYASYSRDGSRLAFTSNRTGHDEIWVANADGAQPVQLTDLRHPLTEEADWSPAGDLLAFVSQDRADRQIYVVNSTGGPARAITSEDGVHGGGGWSLDGGSYYYTSARTGRMEVWKAPLDGGRPQQITTNGGQCGFESPRGAFYYWQIDAGLRSALVRRTPGGDRRVDLAPPARTCLTAFSPKGFFYKALDSGDILVYDEASGRSTRIFEHLPRPYNQFTVSPDGRWLLTDFPRDQAADLMIMEHFR